MTKVVGWQFYFFVAGYWFEHIGNLLLMYRLYSSKSVYGVSIDSQILLMIATISRAVWFDDTRLIFLYQAWAEIALAILFHAVILYMCFSYKDSLYR